MFKTCLAPIETIPDEVLSLILECACLCYDISFHLFRNQLLTISRKWQRVILHTPSFWSVLYLSAAQSPNTLLKSLELHLKRSKRYPLDIYLRCFWHPIVTKAIFDRIIPHSERWRRLVIQTPTCDVFSHLQRVPGPSLEFVVCLFSPEKASRNPSPTFSMSNLSNLLTFSSHNISFGNEVPAMPRLRTLDLRGMTAWSVYVNFCGILARFPALEHLTLRLQPINTFQLTGDIQSEDRPPVSLPSLRYLHFITSEGLSHNISRLMRRLHCPNIVSMTIRDMVSTKILMSLNNTPIDKPTDLLSCEADSPKLCVCYIDPYLAWNSLMPPPRLKVLELTAPQWPTHERLEELCSHLTTLETLVLRQFQTSSALEDIGAGSTIPVPSLRTLDIEFIHTRRWQDFHISQFFRIFSLPQLLCLRLQKPRAKEWENLLYCTYYPSLRSLSLVDMKDFISSAASPVTAFPYLTDLHLVNVRSNDFLRRLIQGHPVHMAWPRLRTITIRGDNFVSKPLVHKIVVLRHNMGLRITSLVLDEYHVNEDSRNWLNQYSCVQYVPLQ